MATEIVRPPINSKYGVGFAAPRSYSTSSSIHSAYETCDDYLNFCLSNNSLETNEGGRARLAGYRVLCILTKIGLGDGRDATKLHELAGLGFRPNHHASPLGPRIGSQ